MINNQKGKTMITQGDVVLYPVTEDQLKGAIQAKPIGNDVVLAEGEVTGHAHRIKTGGVCGFYKEGDDLVMSGGGTPLPTLLKVEKPAEITHEEHGAATIPNGTYRVVIQREYTAMGERRVVD